MTQKATRERDEDTVSPYLRRPLRSYEEVFREIQAKRLARETLARKGEEEGESENAPALRQSA